MISVTSRIGRVGPLTTGIIIGLITDEDEPQSSFVVVMIDYRFFRAEIASLTRTGTF